MSIRKELFIWWEIWMKRLSRGRNWLLNLEKRSNINGIDLIVLGEIEEGYFGGLKSLKIYLLFNLYGKLIQKILDKI